MSEPLADPVVPVVPEPPVAEPGPLDRAILRPVLRARALALAASFLIAALLGLGVAAVLALGLVPAPVPVRMSAAAQTIEEGSAPDRLRAAERALAALHPRGVFVTVDTYGNRLRVHRGDEVLLDALCSTGSGLALRDPRNGRLWVFTTPLGERTVQRKAVDPVWVKPDWAFVEEGLVPPPLGSRERVDTFSLGDFALYLGDGYLIHGTLFQTLLGRRVTHGCIRLGDEDLSYVYRTVPVGARVYLY